MHFDLRVHATSQKDLEDFAKLCAVIQNAGDVGHCANLKVVVDGDGSGRFSFQVLVNDKWENLPSNSNWDEKDAIWLGE